MRFFKNIGLLAIAFQSAVTFGELTKVVRRDVAQAAAETLSTRHIAAAAAPVSPRKEDDDVAALAKRTSYKTERGVIIGTEDDSLRTYGLATCIGMAAVGEEKIEVDKVLTHVPCDDVANKVAEFANEVREELKADDDFRIVVSVADPALQQGDGMQAAQRAMNQVAIDAATSLLNDLGEGKSERMRVVTRPSLTTGGTLNINEDGDIYAEGNKIEFDD
ncbi:hypothetical protein F5Y15DRAFT_330054 [Xylariaceae sp. FL0016]|nr:hypothetical protein F5Y15DRAFT_330054 [Xylariaceae sp. FL0016]